MTTEVLSSSQEVKDLYKMALLAREKSYSPYSGHKVGAAIRTSNGKIYTGCNIENSSFGATVCAERVAIQKGISEQGPLQIVEIMVITDATPPWPPCGLCRQVIGEFGKETTIYTANIEGNLETFSLNDLFPLAFTSAHLQK